MKKIVVVLILLCSSVVANSSVVHPIKLTSSMLSYDVDSKLLHIECNVFIDDFSLAISPTLENSINASDLSGNDFRKIENYFNSNFKITINDSPLSWQIESYNVLKTENVLELVFCETPATLKKGDDIIIENSMLFEMFGEIQSNWVNLSFPSIMEEDHFQNNVYEPSRSITL